MFTLKLLLAILISFQVSTCITAQSDVVDDAQKALQVFFNRIEGVLEVEILASRLLYMYTDGIYSEFSDYLQADTNNFRYVLGNISAIAGTVANGRECIGLLVNSSGFTTDIFTADVVIAEKFFDLAGADLVNVFNQFIDLNTTYDTNCVRNEINCEGTSRAVIAEVERLLPNLKRFSLELLTELHVFGYKLTIDLESAHTELMEIYNKAVQNATLCIASKIALQEQDSGQPLPSGSVFGLFEDLIIIVESVTANSVTTLFSSEVQVISQSTTDYWEYIKGVSTATSRANNTIHSLIETAEEYNVTLNCDIPDLSITANASYERIVKEFELLVNDTLLRQYERGVQSINNIGQEIHSITLEIENCAADAPCDYLAEKIALKISEIPWQMQQATNSTIVLLQQSVTAVRESGARVVRDTQEKLEVSLTDLKSCIQNSL